MPLELDSTAWSGEGHFTQLLIDRLRDAASPPVVGVEDAPAPRSDADHTHNNNERPDRLQPTPRNDPAHGEEDDGEVVAEGRRGEWVEHVGHGRDGERRGRWVEPNLTNGR